VYDRSRDSLATLSDAIAQDLATALGARPRRLERRPPDPQAYEAYQRGRSFFLRYDFPTARSLFEEAVGRDSTFAPAWAGLALAWTELADLMIAPRDAFPRAREAARRALALDSTIATAYIALANVTWALDLDCRGGVRLADRAIALDSTLPEAWSARAGMLICAGRGPEALEAARHAWELDSLSAYTGFGLLGLTTIMQPQSLPEVLALVRYRVGASVAFFDGVVAQQRGDCAAAERLMRPIAASDFSNGALTPYVDVLVCLGRRSEADSVVRAAVADSARRYVNPVAVAGALMALGDRDGAMRWLERGADERTVWVTQIQSWPWFEPLRGDPRFEALKRRLGLLP